MKVFLFRGYDMVCRGDESDLCDKCEARFGCYTGELPDKLLTYRNGKTIHWLRDLEKRFLGFHPNKPILGNALFNRDGSLDFTATRICYFPSGLKNDTI